jgi:hypothetical protein
LLHLELDIVDFFFHDLLFVLETDSVIFGLLEAIKSREGSSSLIVTPASRTTTLSDNCCDITPGIRIEAPKSVIRGIFGGGGLIGLVLCKVKLVYHAQSSFGVRTYHQFPA